MRLPAPAVGLRRCEVAASAPTSIAEGRKRPGRSLQQSRPTAFRSENGHLDEATRRRHALRGQGVRAIEISLVSGRTREVMALVPNFGRPSGLSGLRGCLVVKVMLIKRRAVTARTSHGVTSLTAQGRQHRSPCPMRVPICVGGAISRPAAAVSFTSLSAKRVARSRRYSTTSLLSTARPGGRTGLLATTS